MFVCVVACVCCCVHRRERQCVAVCCCASLRLSVAGSSGLKIKRPSQCRWFVEYDGSCVAHGAVLE